MWKKFLSVGIAMTAFAAVGYGSGCSTTVTETPTEAGTEAGRRETGRETKPPVAEAGNPLIGRA